MKDHFKLKVRPPDKGASGEAEYKLYATGSAKGYNFIFKLKGNHLTVWEPGSPHTLFTAAEDEKPATVDWYQALTESERVRLMQAVLSHYRVISNNNDVKVAAAGVVDNPDQYAEPGKRHLIYVARNTNIGAKDVYKSCAEQNMIRAAENAFEGHMHLQSHTDMPETPYLREIYVMGGRRADASKEGDKGISGTCPCGLCTDILAAKMIPKGHIYVLPHNRDIVTHPVDSKSTEYDQVAADHIWKTTIENLNRHRHNKVDEEVKGIQRGGMDYIAKRIVMELKAEQRRGYVHPPVDEKIHEQERKNKNARRVSIAELDIATRHNAKIEAAKINDYLRDHIVETLKDRVLRDNVKLDAESVLEWMKKKVGSTNCLVIQLDNNCYAMGCDSETSKDKAFSTPELTAVGNAIKKLGTQGIKNAWYMDFNPAAIAKGELFTPSKDGLERLVKRMSQETEDIEVMVLPPNAMDSQLKGKISNVMKKFTYSIHDLLPGGFMGTGQELVFGKSSGGGGGTGHAAKHKKRHRPGDHHHESYVDRLLSESILPPDEGVWHK